MSRTRQARAAAAVGAFLVGLAGAALPLAAQGTGSIAGTVRHADHNTPIAGVQVSIEALQLRAITNPDGRYQLNAVPAGTHTLMVRYIGFGPERRDEVVIAAGQRVRADFLLRPQAFLMSEIVVTGVTEATSRAKLPFTVAKVTAEEIPVPPNAALQSIRGKVAGASLIPNAQPGAGTSILLRSPTSINKSTTPMIVVDGAILAEDAVDISAQDIESVEVIKGAAAASLYGSRAASGVIQIRTARGSQIQEGRTRFIVRSEYGSNEIMRPIEWARFHNLRMNADQTEFVDASGQPVERQFAAPSQFLFQDQPYPGPTYDHIKALFDPGQYVTNSMSIGYNSGNTSWLATAGQHHTAGVLEENDGYHRYDVKVNLDHRLSNDLSVSMSAFHMRGKQEDPGGNPFFDFIHQAPDVDLLQPDTDGTRYIFQPDPVGVRASPLYQMATQDHFDYRARTLGSLDLRYNPTPWLGFSVSGSYDRSDRRSEDFIPRGVKTPESPNGGIGSSERFNAVTSAVNASAGLTVTQPFGRLQTRSSARLLIEREDEHTVTATAADAAVGGIPDLDAFNTLSNTSSQQAIRSRGYYFTTDLDYDERYIVSALARRDGSSLFGRDERWHWYYRASGAWRLSAEPWWPLPSALSEFKLRYSRGTAGGRPNFPDRFEVFNVGAAGLTLGTLGNTFLQPEKTTEQEFAVDLVAFQRASLSLVYAKQRTVAQLIEVPLPAIFGFTAQWQNAGTIEGHTYEATLETRLLETERSRWSMTFIADRSRNRLVEYDRPCHGVGLANRCAGQVLGEMWGQSLWHTTADLPLVHANSYAAFDVNDDGLLVPVGVGNTWRDGVAKQLWGTNVVIDGVTYAWGMPRRVLDPVGQPARVRIGDASPDLNWGISSQLRLGQLNVYALVGGQIGGNVYNATKQRMYQHLRNREIDQDGKPEERRKPTSYYTGPLYNSNNASQWFVEDAGYTKLREASVRYTLTPRQLPLLGRLKMERVLLSVIGRNLFVLTDYAGYDPEIGGILTRVDDFNFPTYRSVTFSVELEF